MTHELCSFCEEMCGNTQPELQSQNVFHMVTIQIRNGSVHSRPESHSFFRLTFVPRYSVLVVIFISELLILLFLFEVFGIKPMLGKSSPAAPHTPALA